MAYTKVITTDEKPNFLDSAIGLVLKTVQVDDTGIEADEYGYKTVVAGTVYPANDGTAKGIIFEDVDVTHGEHAASLLVAGRVLSERLPEEMSAEAIAALSQIVLVTSE